MSFVDGFVAVIIAKVDIFFFAVNMFYVGKIAKKKAFFEQFTNRNWLMLVVEATC